MPKPVYWLQKFPGYDTADITSCPDQPTTVPPSAPREIPVILSLCLPQQQSMPHVEMTIFPDSGASVCLAGSQHFAKFNLDTKDLIPCHKQVSAVESMKLLCKGWLPINFQVVTQVMK